MDVIFCIALCYARALVSKIIEAENWNLEMVEFSLRI
jgi:hypothetical protein